MLGLFPVLGGKLNWERFWDAFIVGGLLFSGQSGMDIPLPSAVMARRLSMPGNDSET